MKIPQLKLVFVEDSETNAELLRNYTINLNGRKLTIPKGFIFDGNSIPRRLWFWFGHPLEGEQVIAAMVHDYLYRTTLLSRKDADFLYYCILRKIGVCFIKRSLMWLGVRLGGWLHYGKKQ